RRGVPLKTTGVTGDEHRRSVAVSCDQRGVIKSDGSFDSVRLAGEKKTIEADGFVFLIGGIMLLCHRSVMSKRVLCGDNNSRVFKSGGFGRGRGGGRESGRSRDGSGTSPTGCHGTCYMCCEQSKAAELVTLDVTEVKVGCPGKVKNVDGSKEKTLDVTGEEFELVYSLTGYFGQLYSEYCTGSLGRNDLVASTGISDNIPNWFWDTFSGLRYLNISDNNLSSVSVDDFFCSKMDAEQKQVIYMNLGNTNLSGVLPDCWTNWEFLNILNFQDNNLSGEIPKTLANLSSLESLNMRNNKLSGQLPANLMNSKSLQIIDLAENEFIGGIPIPTGEKASILKLLSLRLNKLNGQIPNEICRLDSIQILDLADNNLSGNLPNCFSNFSVMTGKVDPDQIVELASNEFMGSAWLQMKGRINGYSSILGLVTLLDISGNNLSGLIPSEITQLVELRLLNLSSNRLTGKIPEKIGNMRILESLDLSSNQLDGAIPSTISRLSFLNWLNVSYNNLTGTIPLSTQLQSFQDSSFIGNKLCGPPLNLTCRAVEASDGGEKAYGGSDGPDWGLIASVLIGFVVGFWVIVAPLISSKQWRTKSGLRWIVGGKGGRWSRRCGGGGGGVEVRLDVKVKDLRARRVFSPDTSVVNNVDGRFGDDDDGDVSKGGKVDVCKKIGGGDADVSKEGEVGDSDVMR
ncbi:receptor-like protein EIX2, partial [Tanacetum coccineum]